MSQGTDESRLGEKMNRPLNMMILIANARDGSVSRHIV